RLIRSGASAFPVVKSVVAVAKVEIAGNAPERFRMPQKQVPSGLQGIADARYDGPHDFRAEVHRDVATEYHVEGTRSPEGGVILPQIALLEGNHGADRLFQLILPTLTPEISALDLLLRFSQGPGGVARAGGPLHHGWIDVDPENLDVPRFWAGNALM